MGLSLSKIASISSLYEIITGGPPLFFEAASCDLIKKLKDQLFKKCF
jgi:hypothetical protein